jgi:hypothetical protein
VVSIAAIFPPVSAKHSQLVEVAPFPSIS